MNFGLVVVIRLASPIFAELLRRWVLFDTIHRPRFMSVFEEK